MEDLIKALTILAKYTTETSCITCIHALFIVHVDPLKVAGDDLVELERIGFLPDEDEEYFYSSLYGSC